MFDIPLSGTINIYRTRREYDTYDKTSTGGGLGISYPVYDYTRASLSYRYDDNTNITDDHRRRIGQYQGAGGEQRHQRHHHGV
jgi:outer membrane protein assembly factor BamA